MLSDGIVSFWNAFDEPQTVADPLALTILRQTRARLAKVWRFRART